ATPFPLRHLAELLTSRAWPPGSPHGSADTNKTAYAPFLPKPSPATLLGRKSAMSERQNDCHYHLDARPSNHRLTVYFQALTVSKASAFAAQNLNSGILP